MLKALTAKEMQACDTKAIKQWNIPGIILMENAGRGICDAMRAHIPGLPSKKVVIFCGKGNNGGDGFVIARHLVHSGSRVDCLLTGKRSQLSGDARTNADVAHKMSIPIHELSEKNVAEVQHVLRHAHVVVDALFGTGLTRPAGGLYEKLIRKINSAKKFTVAVDIPSGIDSDSGQLIGQFVKTDLTCVLAGYKRSHLLHPSAEEMGELELIDISMPPAILDEAPLTLALIEEQDIRALFPKRRKNTHKGSYGHVLVIAGSRGKCGAAGLSALAALRAGAGLVTLAVPESCQQALEFYPMEAMTVALPETPSGAIASHAMDILLPHLKGKTALALGPGLGTGKDTMDFIKNLLPKIKVPLVVDADGLNILSKQPGLLKKLPKGTILTPHPKEMSRLCKKKSTQEILCDPFATVQAFAKKHKVTLVLKGAGTLIGFADGKVRINPTGNPGMATGGSGDVLTGIIAGLLAQNLSPQDAAMSGVYLHGLAGDVYAGANSETTLIAGDLFRTLPDAMSRILP